MTPEFEQLIASYPDLSEENIKLIFIRDRAKKAYVENLIREATKETLSEIIVLGTVASASKDDIRLHIGNLEKCRNYLSAMLQGYKIGFAEDIEPKIKAKHEQEAKEARAKKPKTLEATLAQYGLDASDIANKLASLKSSPLVPNSDGEVTKNPIKQEICPKCNQVMLLPSFHKC